MHFFIIPTNACNSSCKYCFGQNMTGNVMHLKTFNKAITLLRNLAKDCNRDNINITFHGGEPLLAGIGFYKKALPYIHETFNDTANIGIQSNLWNLNKEFCEIFKHYQIHVGTSLDGPEILNDFQRDTGYFRKTIAGVKNLRKQNFSLGCIVTFTSYSAPKYKEIFDFFLENELPFDIHSAVKPLNFNGDNSIFLSPEAFGKLLINMLDYYLQRTDKIKIGTLDTLIKNVTQDKSGLCTFTKCLGNYLAIDSSGDLYTCNRFVGKKEFSVGSVNKVSSWEDIKKTEVWKKFEAWQQMIDEECVLCLHKNICHGGCMYVGFASGNGKPVKDPNCEAYKMIYKHILDKGTDEFFSDANIDAIPQKESSTNNASLLRKGSLLQIMNNGPHPYDIARLSKKIVASALLGFTNDPERVSNILFSLNLLKSEENASTFINKLVEDLTHPNGGFINLYLHITGVCNLYCSHCYAYPNEKCKNVYLPLNNIVTCIKDAAKAGFRKIVITGGEPLLHPDFSDLLDFIIDFRKSQKNLKIILRTNLSLNIDEQTLAKITSAFNQIAVSIDGTEQMHDKRRGAGAYKKTIDNLQRFDKVTLHAKVSLSTVFDFQNLSGQTLQSERQHIIALKEKYEISDIRFLPILPLGRANKNKAKLPEIENISIAEWMNKGYVPRSNCGLGYNLMIDYDGSVYPCHVYKKDNYYLNNILETALPKILETTKFIKLKQINVNTTEKCSKCNFRYLCGGVCKVWQNENCDDLYKRSENLFLEALKILKVPLERFNKLGLK